MPNGLLPPLRGGRAAGVGATPGRGPAGAPGPSSGIPTTGVGRGAGRGVAVPPRSRAARTASCSAFSAAARTSAAATSMSWALVGLVTGDGAAGAFFAAAVLRGGAGLTPALPSVAASGAPGAAAAAAGTPAVSMVARSRRATGASIVLDADLTYSPIS